MWSECFSTAARLNQDLRAVESRQATPSLGSLRDACEVLLDRRLVELDAQVQALQEQQMTHSFAGALVGVTKRWPEAQECSHRAVALGAHRALKTAKEVAEESEWKRCMEVLGIDGESERERMAGRLQQELLSAQRRIEELGERMEVQLAHVSKGGTDGKRLESRLAALEQSHRKLATGAQRALHMALSVREKQAKSRHITSS